MGPVSIISKIGVFIIRIGVVANTLTDSKLKIPLKKIEIKMGEEAIIIP